MNDDVVRKWILKAENDLKIGKDEMLTEEPATDPVCFHMQQCVEKYLKAFLIYHNQEIRKTHDIAELLTMCLEIDDTFHKLFDINAHELTDFAIEVRYPDELYFPSIEETKEAIDIAEKVKEFVLIKLKEKGFKI